MGLFDFMITTPRKIICGIRKIHLQRYIECIMGVFDMRRRNMMQRFTEHATLAGEPILKQPLLELCGENRLLIEHHMGIGEYSSETIHVNVKFGCICVTGTDLELCCMTAEQLVITGNIEMFTLRKGRSQ